EAARLSSSASYLLDSRRCEIRQGFFLLVFRRPAFSKENYFLVMPTTSPCHTAVLSRRFQVGPGVLTRPRLLVLRMTSSAASAVRFSRRMVNELSQRPAFRLRQRRRRSGARFSIWSCS